MGWVQKLIYLDTRIIVVLQQIAKTIEQRLLRFVGHDFEADVMQVIPQKIPMGFVLFCVPYHDANPELVISVFVIAPNG